MAATLDIIISNNETKNISVPYMDTEPTFFILERIRSKLGTKTEDIKRQDLYLNGKRIFDLQKSVDYYRIFGRTLTYRALADKDITIEVVPLSGPSDKIVCQTSSTVKDLKDKYWQMKGGYWESRFIYNRMEMHPDDILHDLGIRNDCTVYIIVRLRGGGSLPGIVFSDVSDTSNVRKIEFSQNAPSGRFAAPGTNVECDCICTPTHNVICTKGYGRIELSEETFECPNCGRSDGIVPITVGFMECKHRFHGIKETGEQYSSEWVEVKERDCYQLFDASNTITWRRLMIESVKQEERSACTICLDKLLSFETLSCGHQFHTECINGWAGECPNCRYNKHLKTGRAAVAV
ncbi:hypothetical protein EC991_004728 [Linnemannia zychae]|nr:hypothetical protein EC991_004728 [Linnemannia zychae]